MSRKNRKVVKMKRRPSYFLGTLFFLFSIYLLVLFIQSFTKEHVSIYEVNQKQIADNESLRGIILRDEELVTTKQAGYINYYLSEGSKLSTSATVYSINQDEPLSDTAASVDTSEVTLSDEDTQNIRNDIASFRENADLSDYSNLLNFRYNIDNTLMELSDINLSKNLSQLRKESGNNASFSLVKAKKTGIISFATDGYEDLSIDKINASNFKEMTDQWKQLRTGSQVKAGTPVYRLVKSEKWSIVVKLTKEQYQKITQKDSVSVTIKKDNITMSPTIRAFTTDGDYFANLIFDKYMIHYLNNRYLDIEIEFNSASGLKIPVSSIIEKKCYVIPKDYITSGAGKTNQQGVAALSYSDSGKEQIDFIPVEIYYKDENDNVYIDTKLFDIGTTIIDENNPIDGKLQVTDTKKLEGVYNCNQGYCRFRYVKKLYENQEYAIVENGVTYSLSNYDHIILNPDTIQEDDIIY
ncbi:MAG: HlyD family efflux transporter periplasmic adaptor subunit [Butyribacter sp.]|nr:HlyD family efflux transporter periplasmic adaptor subunit [bacterium]MDY3853512.1 HlyD family efflux transporter periplasmic adaptor subunit [Butyribacter sp.]